MSKKIEPISKEIKLSFKKYIVSKTNLKGVIIYANDYFTEISKYNEVELIGSPHNILRHPDMPSIIFKLIWNSIEKGRHISAIIKNRTKDDDYYWIRAEFEIQKDIKGNIKNYIAYRQAVPKKVIKEIEPLYKKLLDIEKAHGINESLEYLTGFLEEKDMSYQQYINNLAEPKGIHAKLFKTMKKLF